MRKVNTMQPNDDRNQGAQLNGLLREWVAPEPSPALDQRVMKACTPRHVAWWRFLVTGYIRVPVYLVFFLAALLSVTVWQFAARPAHAPCVAVGHAAPPTTGCDHPAPGIC